MAARYRKIDPGIWTDEKFRKLKAEEQRIAPYALTAQTNRIGLFTFSQGKACEDLGMPHRARARVNRFRVSRILYCHIRIAVDITERILLAVNQEVTPMASDLVPATKLTTVHVELINRLPKLQSQTICVRSKPQTKLYKWT
jgi:hypothetical protein